MSKSYKNIFEVFKNIYPCKKKEGTSSPRIPLYNFLSSREGHFQPLEHYDGKVRLYPHNPTGFLYRGQNKWYKNIKPKIYRKGISEFKRFTYILMLLELEVILKDHPIVQDFNKSNFHVSVLGIAQHYGIPTEWIDFTADPMIAAFFAISKEINGKYKIVKKGIGVIYKSPLQIYNQYGNEECDILGLQPFERPSVQKAYTLKYSKSIILNWHEMKFLHNSDCSEKIFDRFKGGELLFPKDFISEKVSKILNSNNFSKETLNLTKKKYPQYSKFCNRKYLHRKKINIVEKSIHSLSDQEILLIQSQYNSNKSKTYNMIEDPLYFFKLEK